MCERIFVSTRICPSASIRPRPLSVLHDRQGGRTGALLGGAAGGRLMNAGVGFEFVIVEEGVGQAADGRVHAVLPVEHRNLDTSCRGIFVYVYICLHIDVYMRVFKCTDAHMRSLACIQDTYGSAQTRCDYVDGWGRVRGRTTEKE